jgi:putative ABC transport system ATP-binding protein
MLKQRESNLTTDGTSSNRTAHSGGWSSARQLYRYIWHTSRPGQIAICLLVAIITPLQMVSLEFQRRIVDDAVGARNVWLLAALGVGYFAVVSVRLALKYLLDIIKGKAAETIARDLRLRIMRGTQAIRASRDRDGGDEQVGTTISMLGAETEDMSGFAGDALSLPLLRGGTVIWVVGYLMWIEPLITALALVLYIPQLLIVPATQHTINRLARLRILQLRNLSQFATRGRPHKGQGRNRTSGHIFIDRLYRFRIQIYIRKFFLAEFGNFSIRSGQSSCLYLAAISPSSVRRKSAPSSCSSPACRKLPIPGIR